MSEDKKADVPALPDLDDLPELPDPVEIPELPDDALQIEAPAKAEAPSPPPAREASPPPRPAPPSPPKAPAPKAAAPPAARKEPTAPRPPATPAKAPPARPAAAPAAASPARAEAPKAPKAAEPAAKLEEVAAEVPAPVEEVEAPSAARPLAPGEKPPLRELEKAPQHLGKAALIVSAGSLIPWMGAGGGPLTWVGGKLLVLLGCWLWLKQVEHNWGPSLPGVLGKLADLSLRPKPKNDDKKRRARAATQQATSLDHPFPTGLHLLSLILIVFACVGVPMLDAGVNRGKAMAELGMLAWAAYTWVHIKAYERWGKFNPIFAMMFIAMVISGVLNLVAGIQVGVATPAGLGRVLGGVVVGSGGLLAAYTIFEAMKQAKKEGDVKKKAAAEARKAARAKRGS